MLHIYGNDYGKLLKTLMKRDTLSGKFGWINISMFFQIDIKIEGEMPVFNCTFVNFI